MLKARLSKIGESIKSVPILSVMVFFTPTLLRYAASVVAATSPTDFFCKIIGIMQQLAFYGVIAGAILFGVYKIWSIVSPQTANQTRDYVKNAGFGILAIAGAVALAQAIFNTMFGEGVFTAPDCPVGGESSTTVMLLTYFG